MKSAIKKIMKGGPQFEQVLDEAVELHRSLAAATNTFGDSRDEKLSARGYLKEALANARTDLLAIKKLDQVVLSLPEQAYPNLTRFVTCVTKQAAATKASEGCNLRPVTGNLHFFVGCDQAAFSGVLIEAMGIGSNVLQLVALAAYRATRDFPDNFGSIEDWDAAEAEQKAIYARLGELYAEIATAWHEATYRIEDIDASGRGRILLTVKGVDVPLGDPETLGERLCELLL